MHQTAPPRSGLTDPASQPCNPVEKATEACEHALRCIERAQQAMREARAILDRDDEAAGLPLGKSPP